MSTAMSLPRCVVRRSRLERRIEDSGTTREEGVLPRDGDPQSIREVAPGTPRTP